MARFHCTTKVKVKKRAPLKVYQTTVSKQSANSLLTVDQHTALQEENTMGMEPTIIMHKYAMYITKCFLI